MEYERVSISHKKTAIRNFSSTTQVTHTITKIYCDQIKIGWKHLLVGRLNCGYATAITQCLATINSNEEIQRLVKVS